VSDYTRGQNFAAMAGLDALPAVFDTEFNSVATASATKADKLNPTFSGTVVIPALAASVSHAGDALKTSPAQSGEVYMHAFKTGTKMPFYQATAPTGWTQDTTNNDAILRVVSGSGGVAGGSTGFVGSPLNVTDGHTLIISEMPAHTHDVAIGISTVQTFSETGATTTNTGPTTTSSTGGGGAHTHPITWTPKYIDMIVCTKD